MSDNELKEKVKLDEVINEVTEELFLEKCKEVKTKVRLVLEGVNRARLEVSKAENNLKKAMEVYEKGLNKLDQVRKGNWAIIEKQEQEKSE